MGIVRQDELLEHRTFQDAAGKVVRAAVKELRASPEYRDIGCRYIYAVKCATDNPAKRAIQACGAVLRTELDRICAARRAANRLLPLVIVAHGTTALRALGITAASENEIAGAVYDIARNDIPFKVVASRSMKSIVGQPGKYSSLVADVRRAFDLANQKPVVRITQEELETRYRYPKTIEEVAALVDEVLAYRAAGWSPDDTMIAIDTETNTLFPHRDGLQLTIVSVAWAPGLAAAIPLWHKDTPYDPAEAWPHVIRLLRSRKKKVFHNCKYDLKVFWKMGVDVERVYWDVMLAEHALEEDKKGQYGLKYLVKQYLPQYAGYEDQLHDMLAKAQGERQLDNARREVHKASKSPHPGRVPDDIQVIFDATGLKREVKPGAPTRRMRKLEALKAAAEKQAADPVLKALQELRFEPPYNGNLFRRTLSEQRTLAERLRTRIDGEGNLQPLSDTEARFVYLVETVPVDLKRYDLVEFTREQEAELWALQKVLPYITAGYFEAEQANVEEGEQPKQEAKSGGFENIPLWNEDRSRGVQLFYAAVDTDVTWQLAAKQYKRMLVEDTGFKKKQVEVAKEVATLRLSASGCPYEVRPLCQTPDPVVNLVKHGYIPRARELCRTEYDGVKVDLDYIDRSSAKLTKVINAETERLHKMAGEEVKLGDSRRIALLLFDIGRGYLPSNPEHAAKLAEDNPGRVKWTGERLMYHGISYTEHGAVQTTEKVLKTLAITYECEFANSLLLLRKAVKARDTFLRNVQLLSRHDGRLHTNYNLNGTATGRLSSSDINMQNIPKGEMGGMPKTDPRYRLVPKEERQGVNCKRMFIPDDDSLVFVNADAKGAEVKIFAAYSRDPALIAALRDGMDAHSFFSSIVLNPDKVAVDSSGAKLFGEARRRKLREVGIDDDHAWSYADFEAREDIFLEGVGPEGIENGVWVRGNPDAPETWQDRARAEYGKSLKKLRDIIKRVVFGILFGAGYRKIAEIVGIEKKLAKDVIQLLFKMFPTIPSFIAQTKWELGAFGMVETYFGRKRRFSIDGAPSELLSRAQRQAVNFKIQSSNSDIVLDCLEVMAPQIRHDFGGGMYLTVHDSLGFGVKKKYIGQLAEFIRREGTERVARLCPWMPVPYLWDVEIGPTYGDLKSIAKYMAAHPEDLILPDTARGYVEEEMLDELRHTVEGEEETAA
jgi:DNA polymerase I-like protein with 3'-5' exonuclease and polymerase domains